MLKNVFICAKSKLLQRKFFLFPALLISFALKAEFASNKFDNLQLASFRGIGASFYSHDGQAQNSGAGWANIYLSPFYFDSDQAWAKDSSQSTSIIKTPATGSNPAEYYKVGPLEESGFWNVAGIFYGFASSEMGIKQNRTIGSGSAADYSPGLIFAPKGFVFDINDQAALTGQGELSSEDAKTLIGEANWTSENYQNYYTAFLKSVYDNLAQATMPNFAANTGSSALTPSTDSLNKNFATKSVVFSSPLAIKNAGLRRFSPAIKKMGLRIDGEISFLDSFKITFKSGAGEVRVNPDQSNISVTTDNSSQLFIASDSAWMEKALNDLGLSNREYQHFGFEDTFVAMSASQGFDLRDDDKSLIVSLYPFARAGAWLPTSKKFADANPQKSMFYVPMGNEGHIGVSVSGGLSIEVPDSAIFSICGGGTYYLEETFKNYRVPNHPLQVGVYPFTIDIKRKKGELFYAVAEMRSINFSDNASFFCNLTFTTQKRDKITLADADTKRNILFEKGAEVLAERSSWSSTDFCTGINVKISDEIQLGFGFATNIKGKNVARGRTMYLNTQFSF